MRMFNVIKIIGLVVASLAFSGQTSFADNGTSQLPNIVYILADDMGYGDVSVLNPESKIKTPNLDRMANEGMIFTADNGCASYIGVEEFVKAGHHPSWIYKGYKASIYEGGHRIPFLVKWPRTIKAKSKHDQTICLTDLLATCAELVGEPLPENAGENSLSFLPAMRGEMIDTSRRQAVVHHDYGGKSKKKNAAGGKDSAEQEG